MHATSALKRIAARFNRDQFLTLNEEMSFGEYLDLVEQNPLLVRTAFQRIYDMIVSDGTYQFERYRKTYTHYNFFDDEATPIFGLEGALDSLVKFIRGAAGHYGSEKRVLLLHGPVGSAKSTIARRLKRGLETYSRTPAGAWYTYKWVNLPTGADGIYTKEEDECPMHDDPLRLIPLEDRPTVLAELNDILREKTPPDLRNTMYTLRCDGELNPRCKKFMGELLRRNNGDWEAVVNKHIRVIRKVHSEADRMGIGTFQPKDEKNQDATELTGDIDFSRLPHFGQDSDPRCMNYDGELCCGNRGMVEFIEMLKLAQEFLYDLLGASQEKQIKPKKSSQIHIDEMILGHSNGAEFQRLMANEYMEALKDRTVRIDVPYLLRLKDEIKVLEQDYGPGKVKQHVAPHTLEIAALWAVLTRLEDDKEGKLDLVQKAKLYNDETLPNYNEESVKELRKKHDQEGMTGVSARYVQDKISNCLAARHDYINMFMVMNEIREGLDNYALISDKDMLARYHTCIDLAMRELDEILKDEVRRALTGDEKTIERLCANYLDNLLAYIRKSKIKNQITGRDEPPNERLMRSIEGKINISTSHVDEFRRMIAAFMGDCAHEGKHFKWDTNPELKKALELKLFEDTKDHIKLSALSSAATTVSKDLQEKIDAIKQRLVTQYGYNNQSATDVLSYVGSIYARAELTND